jgi:hexosaminidase
MPGHASAAIAAYPELGCTGQQIKVEKNGRFRRCFCPKEETFTLFRKCFLAEVMQLFPSKYIHIGGDECPKQNGKPTKLLKI